MTDQGRTTRPEPSVYEVIEIKHDTVQVMQVPSEVAGIREIAQWVTSFGDTEVRDICDDGFRYRTVGDGAIGRWHWAEPEDWLVRYANEFDIPVEGYPLPGWRDWQHVTGPALVEDPDFAEEDE